MDRERSMPAVGSPIGAAGLRAARTLAAATRTARVSVAVATIATIATIAVVVPAPAGAQSIADATRAGALGVRTLEHGGWAESIAMMQVDPGAEGSTLHVVVEDTSGARSSCGAYALALDAPGAQAFRVGRCDPQSGATELVLASRDALFAWDGATWRPRRIAIAASELRVGGARGGAAQPAATELSCSLAVRPYLVDLRTGARVRATPDRFALVPVGDARRDRAARVETAGDGWTVRAGTVRVEYELVDRESGEVVLREAVHLACGRDGAEASEDERRAGAIALVPGRVFRGATLTRSRRDDRGSCGGEAGPEQWYVVRLDRPAHLGLRLVSEFDATLYVREGSIDGPEIACRDRAALLETLEVNLAPGTYYVAVDGSGTHGRYRLVSFEDPVDPRALAQDAPRGELASEGVVVADELVAAVSRHHASCGGTEAPEHVYALRVDRPTHVALRLSSRFDSALYLVDAQGTEIDCRSTIGLRSQVRRARVAADLPPGDYWVIVDGESGLARPGAYRLSSLGLPLP